MRILIFYVTIVSVLFIDDVTSQNLFVDPGFDEPVPMPNSLHDCQYYTGENFDKATSTWRRSTNGTPDIISARDSECYKHMDKEFFTSQCVGVYLGYKNTENYYEVKEVIETTLSESLERDKNYRIEIDLLLNKNATINFPQITLHDIRHINVVLKDSKSTCSDTLLLPISGDPACSWAKCSLVFTAKYDFDIVQIDYLSDVFRDSKKSLFVYGYLDNFSLVKTSKKATIFKEDFRDDKSELNSTKFSYYFDRDIPTLSDMESQRMMSNFEKLKLQRIVKIKTVGFTDDSHSIAHNSILSGKRASSALALIRKIIAVDSIQYVASGKGIDRGVSSELARRVDVLVDYKDAEVAPWYQTSNNPQLAFNYSFLGNVELSKKVNNVERSIRLARDAEPSFDKVPFDAHKLIVVKAKQARVVLINESHTSPDHRVFVSDLLPDLRTLGYNRLAVEALQSDDNEQSLTMKDPVFLRYLLDAKNQGYSLVSYDNKSNEEPNWNEIEKGDGVEYADGYETLSKSMNIRDYNQFLNLEIYIDNLPEREKVIIHVGHRHGGEVQIGDWKPLGAYLSEKYGSEAILSIDQVILNDCVSIDSNDYYNQYNPKKSIVCTVGTKPYAKKIFNPISMSYQAVTDLQILHTDHEIRLQSDTSMIYVNHSEISNCEYPLAIMIYESHANPRTDIAYSAIEVKHREDLKPSIIPNDNKYNVLIKDSRNNVVAYDTSSQR